MLHLAVIRLAQATALAGGVVLCALVLTVCASVAGRGLADLAHMGKLRDWGDWLLAGGVGPVTGDFELVEAGIAFAVFSFLPLTQLTGSHATVDVFTSRMGDRTNHVLATFWSLVMLAVTLLIAWRLFAALQDKLRYGDTTFLLQMPVWWAYAASFAACVVACIVGIYCVAMRLTGARRA